MLLYKFFQLFILRGEEEKGGTERKSLQRNFIYINKLSTFMALLNERTAVINIKIPLRCVGHTLEHLLICKNIKCKSHAVHSPHFTH